jgi:hypothetical protein
MSIQRLSILQWVGLLAGGVTWFTSYVIGVGLSEAVCNPASGRWGIPHDTVQAVLMAVAATIVLAAEAAAIVVFRATRNIEEEEPPPHGRVHFFATAAIVANVVFFMIIVLSGTATIVDRACHQA